ncbi:MAG TPA: MBL fold metallo-hydrolase [Terriglobia bacterium]|nr:MBL fold metallo-hydrolase [Terriglobia bacterium]
MAVTVSILGSGSRGNATFIKTDRVRLLIEAGFSRKELSARLEAIGEDPEGIDAVLITHEHTDHVSAIRGLLKELRIEAYMTWGTIRALGAEAFELNGSRIVPIQPGVPFTVGDVEAMPFSIPHDAAEPVAFRLRANGVQISQLTDIGHFSDAAAENLRGADVLILESNHDLDMLRAGPYPWNLKQRLLGRFGHLSNTAVGRFICDQFDGRAAHLLLAHLSSRNNHPELARQESLRALRRRGLEGIRLAVTGQDVPGQPIYLG